MQMEDLENKMKDIQFMKVTREIQAVSDHTYHPLVKINIDVIRRILLCLH